MINKVALKAVIEGTRDERVYLCKQDFALFFVYYFVDYIKYDFAPFHFLMFQDVNDLIKGIIKECVWIAFRESAKTAIEKAFVAYIIAYEFRKYPNVTSLDKENAERVLFDTVTELQTNPRLIEDFGELFNARKNPDEIQQKRVNNFVTNNKVRVEAHSTQESMRGRLHGNQRPDAGFLDDFENNKSKDSQALTEQVWGMITEFLSAMDSATGFMLYVCNYITEHGNVQKLIDRAVDDPMIRVRNFKVLDLDGKPTWPAKYCLTDEEARITGKVSIESKKRQLGSLVFSAEMMNEPIDSMSQKFKKSMFKYRTMEEVSKLSTRKFATIDTALSKTAHSDFLGLVKNYVDKENCWNLVGKQLKLSPGQVIDLIFQLYDEGFETIGVEDTVYYQVLLPFFKEECRKRGKYPHVVPLKHGGVMKESRIEMLVAPYEAGSVYHILGECDDMEMQLLKFPNGLHDDIIDAEQYQSQIAEPPYTESIEKTAARRREIERNTKSKSR